MPPDIALYPNDDRPALVQLIKKGEKIGVYTVENGDVIIYEGIVNIAGGSYFTLTNIAKTTYHGDDETVLVLPGNDDILFGMFGVTPFNWVKIEPEAPTKSAQGEKPYDDLGDVSERLFGGKRKSKKSKRKKRTKKYNSKRKK